MAGFDDITAVIEEFLADSSRSSLQLPHMSTGQRKQAKKLASMHPELRCESYGFGEDRQLHLFKEGAVGAEAAAQATQEKIASLPCHEVHVKNTFIDGWSVPEQEGVIFRSMPTRLNKYLAELEESKAAVAMAPTTSDCSTSASGGASSDADEVQLPAGTQVMVEGLTKAPMFNGCLGVVDAWDAEAGRYSVRLASAASPGTYQQAKIKAENLRPLTC